MINIKGKKISEAQLSALFDGQMAFLKIMEDPCSIIDKIKAAQALYAFCEPFWREEESSDIGLEDAAHEFYETAIEGAAKGGVTIEINDDDKLQIFNFAQARYELVRKAEEGNF